MAIYSAEGFPLGIKGVRRPWNQLTWQALYLDVRDLPNPVNMLEDLSIFIR